MRDPEATRSAILDAAESLFLSQGFGSTSTAEIAERAGVTKSLIHHHFGSKAEVWSEVKKRLIGEYLEEQVAILRDSEPSADLLRRSLELHFRFLMSHPKTVRAMALMAMEEEATVQELFQELNEVALRRLRESQEKGQLRQDIDPAMILAAIPALAEHWFLHRHLICGCGGLDSSSPGIDEAFLDALLKIFMEGVRPRSADRSTSPADH